MLTCKDFFNVFNIFMCSHKCPAKDLLYDFNYTPIFLVKALRITIFDSGTGVLFLVLESVTLLYTK